MVRTILTRLQWLRALEKVLGQTYLTTSLWRSASLFRTYRQVDPLTSEPVDPPLVEPVGSWSARSSEALSLRLLRVHLHRVPDREHLGGRERAPQPSTVQCGVHVGVQHVNV